jgi:hypothetical protein
MDKPANITGDTMKIRRAATLDQLWDDRAKYLEAQRQLWASVQAAREEEATWEEIGTVLGVTRSAAQQRFSKPAPGQLL